MGDFEGTTEVLGALDGNNEVEGSVEDEVEGRKLGWALVLGDKLGCELREGAPLILGNCDGWTEVDGFEEVEGWKLGISDVEGWILADGWDDSVGLGVSVAWTHA